MAWLPALDFPLMIVVLCHSSPPIRQNTPPASHRLPGSFGSSSICSEQITVPYENIVLGQGEKTAFIHLDSTSFCLPSS